MEKNRRCEQDQEQQTRLVPHLLGSQAEKRAKQWSNFLSHFEGLLPEKSFKSGRCVILVNLKIAVYLKLSREREMNRMREEGNPHAGSTVSSSPGSGSKRKGRENDMPQDNLRKQISINKVGRLPPPPPPSPARFPVPTIPA